MKFKYKSMKVTKFLWLLTIISKKKMVTIAKTITKVDMLPGYDKEHTTDTQVSQQNIHPDIRGERIQEGEDARVCTIGLAVQNTYSKSHKGLGKVDDLLTNIGNCQWCNCKVSFLLTEIQREKKAISQKKQAEADNQIMQNTNFIWRRFVLVLGCLNFKTLFSL